MKIIITYVLPVFMVSSNINSLEISNFKSGLVCTASELKQVCDETENIYIKGEDTCIFNKEKIPCTWFGYSFEYSEAKESDEIKCVVTTTIPVMSGDPEKIINNDTSVINYEFKVSQGDGVFLTRHMQLIKLLKRNNT